VLSLCTVSCETKPALKAQYNIAICNVLKSKAMCALKRRRILSSAEIAALHSVQPVLGKHVELGSHFLDKSEFASIACCYLCMCI
jgi:hypothetical protein